MSRTAALVLSVLLAALVAPCALAWSAVLDVSPASGIRKCTVKSGTPGQELVLRLIQRADREKEQQVAVLGTAPGTVAHLGWGEERFSSQPAADYETRFPPEQGPRIIELLTSGEEPATEWTHAREGRQRGKLKVAGIAEAYGECLRRLGWWSPEDDHRPAGEALLTSE